MPKKKLRMDAEARDRMRLKKVEEFIKKALPPFYFNMAFPAFNLNILPKSYNYKFSPHIHIAGSAFESSTDDSSISTEPGPSTLNSQTFIPLQEIVEEPQAGPSNILDVEDDDTPSVKSSKISEDANINSAQVVQDKGVFYGSSALPFDAVRPIFCKINEALLKELIADGKRIIYTNKLGTLPYTAGYAEVINDIKNKEGYMFSFCEGYTLTDLDNDVPVDKCSVPYLYFGIVEGLETAAVAYAVYAHIKTIIHHELLKIRRDIIEEPDNSFPGWKRIASFNIENLLTGVLENTFKRLNKILREQFGDKGRCSLVLLLIIDEFVMLANIGKTKVKLFNQNQQTTDVLSSEADFNPDSESARLLSLITPEITHGLYTPRHAITEIDGESLDTEILMKSPSGKGWVYKPINEKIIQKPPLITGQHCNSKLMGVAGPVRFLGFDPRVSDKNVSFDPFISSLPTVRRIASDSILDGVIILGNSGLVTEDEKLVSVVKESLTRKRSDPVYNKRFIYAAFELVHCSMQHHGGDVCCLLIPFLKAKQTYMS